MRILHVNSYYANDVFYKNLFDRQAEMGEQISVFLSAPRGYSAGGRDLGAYTCLSVNHNRWDRLVFPVKHHKILCAARAQYDRGAFDLIHAHSLFSNGYIAMRLSQAWGVPYVVAVRDADISVFFRRMPHMRPLGRRILALAQKVIFISNTYRDNELKPYLSAQALKRVMDKSEVVTNGIDDFWLENRVKTPRAPEPGQARLISVGRASRRKNLCAAAQAARVLAGRGLKTRMDIVIGAVDDAREMEKLSAFKEVTLHPRTPMRELLPLYRASDIFILPSRRETFGLVYAEAMSQGLPVIYTRGQGFDGQFPDGEVGYAVNCLDPEEMADRVEAILENYDAVARACTQRCLRYDWRDIAARYGQIYREALK